jgi:hypothetical protein
MRLIRLGRGRGSPAGAHSAEARAPREGSQEGSQEGSPAGLSRFPLSRRTILRGAGGAAVALPFLEAMEPRRAAAAPVKRFVFFFFSNGISRDTWAPTGTDTSFTLPFGLEPLKPLQSKLVVFQGVNMETARKNPGNGHNVGMTNLLTARRFLKEKDTQFGAIGWGADATIDQVIAGKVGQSTKFASLQFGVQTFKSYGANAYSYISYAGPQKPVPNEDDPVKMWNRIFSGVGATPASQEERLAKRKSVLDYVSEDFRQLNTRLGGADRAKLESHLNAVREIERRLTFTAQAGPACKRPTVTNPAGGINTNGNYPAIGKLQMDLLTMALACDLTRVATLQWSSGQSGTQHPWAMMPSGHHGVSHLTDEGSIAQLKRVQNWYMQQLYYLAKSMDDIKEAGGTSILDSTALLSCSEVAVGNTHTFLDMPFVLLGSCGGAIKTNRYLRYTNAAHNDLYVSMMNAMGIAATSFGETGFGRGPLPGVVG